MASCLGIWSLEFGVTGMLEGLVVMIDVIDTLPFLGRLHKYMSASWAYEVEPFLPYEVEPFLPALPCQSYARNPEHPVTCKNNFQKDTLFA